MYYTKGENVKSIYYLVIAVFILIPVSSEAATNVILDFENDRTMKRQKNVTYVQPENDYKQQKIDEIESRLNKIEKTINTFSDEVQKLKTTIDNIETRLKQYIQQK